MMEVDIYGITKSYDPTHTTALRNAFAKDMKRRFAELAVVIRLAIVARDCFGLNRITLQTFQMEPPFAESFAYPRSIQKLEAFMVWLREQVNKGILEVGRLEQLGVGIEDAWTNLYLLDSYKRGIIRARYELQAAGFNVPSLFESGGIDAVWGLPFHIDRLGLIFSRAFNELKGITAAMDSQISRILAQGLADGDAPALLARKLVSAINGSGMGDLALTDTIGRFIPAMRRATILARTEIIRAHHVATIQEYRNWGVEGIVVKGEWKTAGDDRVCERCASLEGRIFTLDEIEGMIPFHPQCRCIALPYIEELQKYK
jgi:SPP1 gp7 family putative phage head morphogenesis protein